MKKILLALILVGSLSQTAISQSFSELRNGRGDNPMTDCNFEVFIRRTQVSGKYTTSFGGTTFNFRWRRDGYEKGDTRYTFENPNIGDFLFVIGRLMKGDDVMARPDEQVFGAGFIGWHQWYMNAMATDKLLVSPGITFGDYIFGSKRAQVPAGHTHQMLDPAGYYLTVGPAVRVTSMIGSEFWIDGFVHTDVGFRVAGAAYEPNPGGYPRPLFLNIGSEIHHAPTRTFLGVRWNHLIDRGVNKDAATRVDISLGYSFGKS